MIITISGKPGSGKSTVAIIVAKKLGFEYFSVGDLMGSIAKEKGMTLEKLGEIAKKEKWVDEKLDEYQEKLGKEKDNFVIDSRIGFHFIPHSVKIFLDVDLKEGAKRIYKQLKTNKQSRSDEEIKRTQKEVYDSIKKRFDLERQRYKKYYNVDHMDEKNFDLIVDTTVITAEQAADKIIKFIKTKLAEGVKKALKNGH